MKKINKTTAAVLAGAIVAVIGVFATTVDTETLAAVQTVITAAIVYFAPANA